MEVLEAITILSVLGVVSGTIMLYVFRVIPKKTTKKVAEDTLTRLIKANSDLTAEYEDRQKAMYKSLQQENLRMRKELNPVDEDGEPLKEEVPWEVIMAGAKQMGINPMMLLPFKKQILKYTKGMSIEEIQQMAAQGKQGLGGLLGNQKPQGADSSEFGQFEEKLR